jgi:hypothetical protein
VPNGIYECCTGPRKNRRGSRPQPPGSAAVPHIQTATTPAGYRRGSSVASSLTAVESEPSPIGGGHPQQQYPPYHQHHQQRLLEQEQQMPASTRPMRVGTKSDMNNCDPWDQQQHPQQYMSDTYNNNNNTTTRVGRSPSSSISSVVSTPLSMTSTLSPPTSGTTTPRTMSSSSLCGVAIADRDYDREREWERRRLPNILGSRSRAGSGGGFMEDRVEREDVGPCYYYMTPSPTDSASSPSVTPSPTIHSTTARPYPPPHSHTRDHRSTSISSTNGSGVVPPLFNKGSDVGARFNAWYRPSSPSLTPPPPSSTTTIYHPTQVQEPHLFGQRLPPSINSIGISVGGGGGGGGGMMPLPHYSLRSDTDSKAVAAFRPF